jgi:hypothetical protein
MFIYMKRIISIFAIIIASIGIMSAGLVPVFAQTSFDPCTATPAPAGCSSPLFKTLGLDGSKKGLSGIQGTILSLAGFAIGLLAAVSVLFLILNAYKMMSDNGDGKGYQAGLNGVRYALTGLIVALLSFGIVSIVTRIVGG